MVPNVVGYLKRLALEIETYISAAVGVSNDSDLRFWDPTWRVWTHNQIYLLEIVSVVPNENLRMKTSPHSMVIENPRSRSVSFLIQSCQWLIITPLWSSVGTQLITSNGTICRLLYLIKQMDFSGNSSSIIDIFPIGCTRGCRKSDLGDN
ncbi:hypothetical protein TNCV_3663651 [Trichonephila clavipes]|nr:hypothetical protein TNCV_3663651 [Trichonephila clavipes]